VVILLPTYKVVLKYSSDASLTFSTLD
jgi:hypothetical protein